MDTFCIVFKSLASYLSGAIGLATSIIFISKTAQKWFHKMEGIVKTKRRLQILLGVLLFIFSSLYLFVVVRGDIQEAHEQSPEYRAHELAISEQILLKEHIHNFDIELRHIAKRFARTAPPESAGSPNWDRAMTGIREYGSKLADEGIRSTRLDRIIEQDEGSGLAEATNWFNAADEMDKLADLLPKTDNIKY